eukprot:1577094-Amphidinium_carterae.1
MKTRIANTSDMPLEFGHGEVSWVRVVLAIACPFFVVDCDSLMVTSSMHLPLSLEDSRWLAVGMCRVACAPRKPNMKLNQMVWKDAHGAACVLSGVLFIFALYRFIIGCGSAQSPRVIGVLLNKWESG